MCFSAMVVNNYLRYSREFGAELSIKEFYDLFYRRRGDPKIKLPKAMEAAFSQPQTETERDIKALIDEFHAERAVKFEQDLFAQRKRLADAERKLQTKFTKAATESRRIATNLISETMGKLADLHRIELRGLDSRVFPGQYAPVMIWEDGKRVVKPMRYRCRPAGKPAFYDTKYPGIYNARLDNLEGFWQGLFGRTHGVMLANAFYENVPLHKVERRELAPDEEVEHVVLEFRPRPTQDMLVACLWSRWTGPDEPELQSFAAITDEPPPEVAATGHTRFVVPIKAEYIDAWLNPDPKDLAALYAILDDRQRPYYEHRMAA